MNVRAADFQYQWGFGNEFASEAIPGSLPTLGNNPQSPPFDLYAEQLSGSAFTALPHENRRSWFYRLAPSVSHGAFEPIPAPLLVGDGQATTANPNQLRWDPFPAPQEPTDFVSGLKTILFNGASGDHSGVAVHYFHANTGMGEAFFYNSDGELLIVPQEGDLTIPTECGNLAASPGQIAVIPRGIKFQVNVTGPARGYILENFGAPLRLPHRGPIGANGLANPRDFYYPTAAFHDQKGSFQLITKLQGKLWQAPVAYHPLDVVAWHGNYAPYGYDLRKFNTMNTVSYDHPDPSIFTVLTSPTDTPGVANADFVIFPPRWMVAEQTFRPPYFHRNIMSEYMGLIYGAYDAKTAGGFVPGGGSLHNCMAAHGPDKGTWQAASHAALAAEKIADTMAFMFETCRTFAVTKWAAASPALQTDYQSCWQGFPRPRLP